MMACQCCDLTGYIQELRTIRNGETHYIYFSRFGNKWVDLAPWGNRIPTFDEAEEVEKA